jgi:DNA (cytosine-5)-methyltransferase 1
VFVENSAVVVSRGLGRILSDLAALGYDARWGVFSAGDVGARHERERMFILAHRDAKLGPARPWTQQQYGQFANVRTIHEEDACDCLRVWLEMARNLARMDDGLADQVDRTEAVGNGQVPAVVKLAWETLMN